MRSGDMVESRQRTWKVGHVATTRRLIAATVAWGMAVSTLALLAQGAAAPASADPPTGGTTIVSETFTGRSVADPAWTAQGDSCLTQDVERRAHHLGLAAQAVGILHPGVALAV